MHMRIVMLAMAAAAAGMASEALAQAGPALFPRQCSVCHATAAGQNKPTGPTMHGIVGTKSGAAPGFEFSDAMKAANLTWTDDTLAKYIADPKGTVPGTKMVYNGMKNPDDVKAVV